MLFSWQVFLSQARSVEHTHTEQTPWRAEELAGDGQGQSEHSAPCQQLHRQEEPVHKEGCWKVGLTCKEMTFSACYTLQHSLKPLKRLSSSNKKENK